MVPGGFWDWFFDHYERIDGEDVLLADAHCDSPSTCAKYGQGTS